MAYILNIETSTTNCSVSISKNGLLIGLKEDNSLQFSHAERLHVYIDELLKKANVSKTQIAAVGISKGPGSYTGLRIGVSAAKGLCYALKTPLISIPTLEALARQVKSPEGPIVAMLDARRLEVYSAIYDKNHNSFRETKAEIIDSHSFLDKLQNQKVYFLGDGAKKCKETILHKNAVFIENAFPSAKEMATISYHKFKNETIEDVAYFEPFYLKNFIATQEKKKI